MKTRTRAAWLLLTVGAALICRADHDPVKMAIEDMAETWPERFADADELLEEYARLVTSDDHGRLETFKRAVLLRNPLLDFDQLLFVRRHLGAGDGERGKKKRKSGKKGRGLYPSNFNSFSNSSLKRSGYDNEVAMMSIREPGQVKTVYRPENGSYLGDLDLHFNAKRFLFSAIGANGAWQVMEMDMTTGRVREVTRTEDKQIDNYDACYLPDDRIIFTSTAPNVGVPCVGGSAHVANAYRCNADGSGMEQLTFDQDHAWCPQMMADGRVLYLRWEYADLPHAFSRILMTMNPDGTDQRSYYGTSSFWPNAIFYARQIPGETSMFVGIVTGHHGVQREGELILFDTSKGYMEADGVVQRMPGYGKDVKPVVADNLVKNSHPRFLHPFPLSSKYFLASSNLGGDWAIYLVDVFDNMTLLKSERGYALLEPAPLQKTPLPPVQPDRVTKGSREATVFMSDIYEGPGLRGIPRGEVKRLRLFTYTFGYQNVGGLYGTIGQDGPWDMRRILGTVPVEDDGSAAFKVPANTPISVQPLDSEGKALQLMRSWLVARPGESLSCVGCHEPPGTPRMAMTKASRRAPSDIQPWRGPARNYAFQRDVQPVLDRYCLSCHGTSKPAEGELAIRRAGKELPYLGGDVMLKGWTSAMKGKGRKEQAGRFSVSYFNLFRHTRHSGIESDMRVLTPMEFHADTCELVMMLKQGHPTPAEGAETATQVSLDEEAWDRLTTWIDLNRPYHGRWSQVVGDAARSSEARRAGIRKLYAGIDENHEQLPEAPEPVVRVAPEPVAVNREPRPPNPKVSGARKKAAREMELGNSLKLELVHVPSGSLGGKDVKACWMGRLEVSNAQFAQFDSDHDSGYEDRHGYQFGITSMPVNAPDLPAVRLTWQQANAFCDWLAEKTGKTVRLPSELEWEWACRAGTSTAMNYGDVDDDFSKHGNMADVMLHHFSVDPYVQDWQQAACNNPENIFDNWIPQVGAVNDAGFLSVSGGRYEPNAWGLHDMHGNVAEWTASLLDPETPGKRVVRGGSWYDRPKLCASSFRRAYREYQKVYNVGFRVLVEEDQESVAQAADRHDNQNARL